MVLAPTTPVDGPPARTRRGLSAGLVPLASVPPVAAADDRGRFEAVALTRDGYHEAFVVCPGRARMRVLFVMSDKPETALEVRVPRAGKVVLRSPHRSALRPSTHGRPVEFNLICGHRIAAPPDFDLVTQLRLLALLERPGC
jgi:hypothetical protein